MSVNLPLEVNMPGLFDSLLGGLGGGNVFTSGINGNTGVPQIGGFGSQGVFNPAQSLSNGFGGNLGSLGGLGSLLGGGESGGGVAQASGSIDSAFSPFQSQGRQGFFDPFLGGGVDATAVGSTGALALPGNTARVDADRRAQVGAFDRFQQGRGFFEGGEGFNAPQNTGGFGQNRPVQSRPTQPQQFGGQSIGDSLAASPQGSILQLIMQSLLTNGSLFR